MFVKEIISSMEYLEYYSKTKRVVEFRHSTVVPNGKCGSEVLMRTEFLNTRFPGSADLAKCGIQRETIKALLCTYQGRQINPVSRVSVLDFSCDF